MASERYSDAVRALGSETHEALRTTPILVVGAGGIGCELLKNLVLIGAESIVTVDLDTIDVSNLNRQFLFRKKHVGMSKALVARDVVVSFNPNAKIEAFHANIKEKRFGLEWFKGFRVVINALDNVDARRHVNRMCLATNVPLIEAGTTGYLGQVFVIQKGETACYECFPKPTRVVYPICTIRSTPDKPVHCIVWAKELHKLFFGVAEDSMLFEPESEEEKSTYMAQVLAVRALAAAGAAKEDLRAAVGEAFSRLCVDELLKQIAMDKYKAAARPPAPLDGAELRSGLAADGQVRPPSEWRATGWDRKAWSVPECAAELGAVFDKVYGDAAQAAKVGTLDFDKDDTAAMFFVAAASNLRATIFGIKTLSLYDAKGVAGNIIPAIATTNAIVAGLQVQELLNVIENLASPQPKSLRECCSYTYCLREQTRKGLLLQPTKLEAPQAGCYVCQTARVFVAVDTLKMTLAELVDLVVVKRFGFVDPAIDSEESGIYDRDDDRLRQNDPKKLADLPAGGVVDGTELTLTDYATDIKVLLTIRHHTTWDEKVDPEGFRVLPANETEMPAEKPAAEADAADEAPVDEAPADEAPPAKKARKE
ncbi:hypothetical protein M885DRAFT_505383 [Pelagophyceae sp. CCMP2097]|nr:hypothetical protein M885DRAFT_505383 [Pelagophyceae sp. CCMP2097]|eukprot:CAMPEP_0184082690 /NCGR_PEP_ID=MMETSP0974-20121125/3332_1 /TAXON_ID=483370 /ORGANISM="non described non described, Strain CCMP2097" /LENGTH=594 /DNA_ID=CAMNT_0026385365 /DNA_START=26 /DNA_END=1810 /DNA_ORIENTATION=-